MKNRNMDIQSEKLRLIQWLAGLNDAKVLSEFIQLKKAKELDWWDDISLEEREEIETGILQAESGEVSTHSEVMEKYKKWL